MKASQWQIPILPYLIPPYGDPAFPNSGHYLEICLPPEKGQDSFNIPSYKLLDRCALIRISCLFWCTACMCLLVVSVSLTNGLSLSLSLLPPPPLARHGVPLPLCASVRHGHSLLEPILSLSLTRSITFHQTLNNPSEGFQNFFLFVP